jgi:hypothetical protein
MFAGAFPKLVLSSLTLLFNELITSFTALLATTLLTLLTVLTVLTLLTCIISAAFGANRLATLLTATLLDATLLTATLLTATLFELRRWRVTTKPIARSNAVIGDTKQTNAITIINNTLSHVFRRAFRLLLGIRGASNTIYTTNNPATRFSTFTFGFFGVSDFCILLDNFSMDFKTLLAIIIYIEIFILNK